MLQNSVIACCAGFLAALVAAPLMSAAQELPKPAQTGPQLKAVGVPSNAKPEVVPSLIARKARPCKATS
jgi:hypothetical protein